MSSKDDGSTWSAPRSLVGAIPKEWKKCTSGTGNSAVQLRRGKYKGRLIASFYGDGCICFVMFSDDHGKTWQLGGSYFAAKNGEPSITELSDGRLVLSPRHREADKGRKFLISEDGGESFSEIRCEPALPMYGQGEIVACEPFDVEGKGIVRPIVCCGPAKDKTKLTVTVSLDDCKTWPISRIIDAGHAANLALVAMPEGKVGVLYERDKYRRLSFQCVDIKQIINSGN